MWLVPVAPQKEEQLSVLATPVQSSSIPPPPPLPPLNAKIPVLKQLFGSIKIEEKEKEIEKVNIVEEIKDEEMKDEIPEAEEKVTAQITLSLLENITSFLTTLITKNILELSNDKPFQLSYIDILVHITRYQSPQLQKSTRSTPLVNDTQFKKNLRIFYFALLDSSLVTSANLDDSILSKIGLTEKEWPLFVPLEHLILATRIVSRKYSLNHQTAARLCSGFINSLRNGITNEEPNERVEIINPENIDFLLFTFYLLNEEDRTNFFNGLIEVSQLRGKSPQLALTRVLLMIDFIGKFFDSIPEELEQRIESNFFSSQKSTYISCPLSVEVEKSGPILFQLTSSKTPFQEKALKILLGECEEISKRYYNFIKLLNITNSQTVSSKSELLFDTIVAEYYFQICWKFLNNLPVNLKDFFAQTNLESLEKNEILLLLCAISKSSTNLKTTEAELELANYLKSLLVQLQSIGENLSQSITSNPRVLTLLNGIIQIFNTSFIPIESESEGAGMIDLFAEESDPLEIEEPQNPIKDFYQQNLEAILKSLLSLSTDLISLLKSLRLKEFPDEEKEKFKLVDLLLRTSIPKDSIMACIKKLISPESLAVAKEWGSSVVLNLKDIKDPTERLSASYTLLDKLYLGDFVIDSSTRTIKVVLCSLVEQLSTLLQYTKDLKIDLSPEITNGVLVLLIDINTDSSIKFLSKEFNFNGNFFGEKEDAKVSVYSHSIKIYELLYNHLTSSFPVNSDVYDICEESLRSCLKFTTDALKKLALIKHFTSTPDLTFPITSVFKLSLSTQNVSINQQSFELISTILKFPPEKEEPFHELKKYTISCFENIDEETLSAWVKSKLLGETESRKSVIKLLFLLSGNSHVLSDRILRLLFNTFESAFLNWSAGITDFFPLIKKLASQSKFPELISLISKLVQSEEFTKLQSSKESYFSAVELVVEFLRELFKLLSEKKADKNENMEIVDESVETEQELCKKLCTYTITEDTYMDQHWYYCFTCNLVFSDGVCTICAKVCHKGHEVTYARKSRFFCDCGPGTKASPCKCLQPRQYEPPKVEVKKEAKEDNILEIEAPSNEEKVRIVSTIKESKLVSTVVAIYNSLLGELKAEKQVIPESSKPQSEATDIYFPTKKLTKGEIFTPRKVFKTGFDIKLKADGPETREIKQLLSGKMIYKNILDYSTTGMLAIADNSGVNIGFAPKLLDKDKSKAELDKSTFKSAAKAELQFQVLFVCFNPLNPNFLAVSGLKECVVLTLNAKGEVADQLVIDLSLDSEEDNAGIVEILWLPGSQVKLAVVTTGFVKVFDLSKDNICPTHYFLLLEDTIRDACCMEDDQGVPFILVIAATGMVFVQELFDAESDGGPCIMIEALPIDAKLEGKGGSAIYYSQNLDLVFVSYADGKCFAGKLDSTKTMFTNAFAICSPETGPYTRFVEFPADGATITCISKKVNASIALKIQKEEILQQPFKISKVESIAAVPVKGKADNTRALLILTEDGTIHRYDLGDDLEEPEKKDAFNKLSLPNLLASVVKEEKSAPKVNFPIDYFEHVDCITPSIELAGDVLLYYKSDVAKQRLASNEEYLTSSNPEFKIIIKNSNPEIVMVGVRILVGNAAQNCIPKTINIFDRSIQCKSTRRWYDIPFTVEESLKADKEFSFTAVGAQAEGSCPVIDSLEVYGNSKVNFGWAEKCEKYSTKKSSKPKALPQLKIEQSIIQTGECLSSYFSLLNNEEKEVTFSSFSEFLQILPPLLNEQYASSIHNSVKHLLSSLHLTKKEYYQLKDRIQLEYVATNTVSAEEEDNSQIGKRFTEESFSQAVATCRQVITLREVNFFTFLARNTKFPSALLKVFWAITTKNPFDWKVRQTIVADVVKILVSYTKYLQVSAKKSDMNSVKASLKLILELLSSTDDFVRLTSSKYLGQILSEPSNLAISEELLIISGSAMEIDDIDNLQEVDEELLFQMALEMSLNNGPKELEKPLKEYSPEQLTYLYLIEEFGGITKLGVNSIAYLQLIFTIIKSSKSEEIYNERVNTLVKAIFSSEVFNISLDRRNTQVEFSILLLKLLSSIIKDPQSPNPDAKGCEVMCGLLCSNNLLEVLLSFLEILHVQFKKLPKDRDGNKEATSNGSLLVPSTKAPAESLSPFFSESYVKKNADLFADYKKLLLESILYISRLIIKTTDKLTNSEGWTQVLCKYMNSPQTSDYSKKVKVLLLYICKDKFNTTRDAGRYEYLRKKFDKLHSVSKCFKLELSYSDSVLLMTTLSAMWQTASARHENWKEYVSHKNSLVTDLFDSCFYLNEEPAQLVLKLLSYIFGPENEPKETDKKKEEKNEDKVEEKNEEKKDDMIVENGEEKKEEPNKEEIIEDKKDESIDEKKDLKEEKMVIEEIKENILITEVSKEEPKEPALPPNYHLIKEFVEFFMRGDQLSRFVNIFLLDFNISSIRAEARNIIHWMWPYATSEQKDFIFTFLQKKVPSLPAYGRNATEFVELLTFCATNIDLTHHTENLPAFLANIINTLKSQNLLLINHPNSNLYQTISTLLDFDGYYLESEPCLVCNDPEVPYTFIKLDSIKTETKFTATTQLVKFTSSYTIQSISADISDVHKSCMAKTVNFYYNNKPVQDITELRNKWSAWKKAKSITLAPAQTDFLVEFPIPITASNFMIEYSTFYENLQSMERLSCPRCNRIVTDRYGVCNNCFENAYQCRQCRNINYEVLNAFLCNECGYCNNAEFLYTISAKPSFASERMESDEDRDKGMQLIEKESANAHKKYLQLMKYKGFLSDLINKNLSEIDNSISLSSSIGKINSKVSTIANIYGKDCKSFFDSLSKSTQVLMASRKELVRYNSKMSTKPDIVDAKVRPPNKCFGCANSFVSLALSLIENLAQFNSVRKVLVDRGLIHELISNNLLYGDENSRTDARRIICLLIKNDKEASILLNNLLSTKLSYCIDNYRTLDLTSCIKNEMQLLVEACQIEDNCWELRLKLLFDLFFRTISFGSNNPIISEQVILPCLKQIVNFTKIVDQKNLERQTSLKYSEWSENQTSFDEWKSSPEVVSLANQIKDKNSFNIASKVARVWKHKAQVETPEKEIPTDLVIAPWISTLLFNRCSKSIRMEISSLIKTLCSTETKSLSFLDSLTTLLPIACEVGDNSVEFFALYRSFLDSEEFMYRKVRLTMKGFLSEITKLILDEINRIRALEDTFSSDISQGYALYTLIEILLSFLDIPSIRRKFKSDQLMIPLLDGFLSLRGIIVQKTKLIDDSGQAILALLKSLTTNEQDNQLFMVACIKALEKHRTGRTPIFIFEQLCGIVCPHTPDPVYYLELNKSPTQEDFFRGSMNRNPYASTETGPLMRDVKNKICRDLDLHGLEDDNGMELIVCDKIIKLDLSIKQVYEKVWKPENGDCPMNVIYRLQGLDGEATEEIVESLPDDDNKEEDPEVKYGITSIMSTCGGLEAIVSQIQDINDFVLDRELANYALKLLYHCLKVKINRQKMLELKSMNILLEKLKLTFPKESLADIAELLLLTIESIVSEANEREDAMDIEQLPSDKKMDSHQLEEGVSQMMMFLEKLGSPLVRCNPRIVKSVTRIIPVLTYGQEQIGKVLLNYFLPYLDFSEFDNKQYEDATHSFHLDCFTSVTNSIRLDPNGLKLKELFVTEKIVDNLYQYLVSTLPSLQASDEEWKEKASKGSLSYVLLALTGITKGCLVAQLKALEYNVVPLVNQLCSISTKNKIGNLAENLLESLVYNNQEVANAVEDCRKTSKEAKAAEAKKHRERVLAAMGIKVQEGKLAAEKPKFDFGEDLDLDEEKGFSCKVCKEGYTFLPNEILGFYVYSKRVSLSKSGNRQEQGYSTVTNFNVIHYQCHKEATKADYELKPRKEEWEGAALRNSSTKCNNIFPIFGPSITEEVYNQNVERYWNTIINNCGRCESTRFRLLAHDLKFILWRLATESSFSEDSRGGNRESNFISVPFYIQMGLYLLDQAGSAQRRVYEASLSQFLKQEKENWISSSTQADNTCFALILSLHLQTLEEWKASKKYFLDRSIIQAFAENFSEEKKSDSPDEKEVNLFKVCRPMLIFFSVVDKLQELVKKNSSLPINDVKTVSHNPDEVWIEETKQKLKESDYQVTEESKEILREIEQDTFYVYENFDEFFDVPGNFILLLNFRSLY